MESSWLERVLEKRSSSGIALLLLLPLLLLFMYVGIPMHRELKKHVRTELGTLLPEIYNNKDKEDESGGHQGPVDLPSVDTGFEHDQQPKEEERQSTVVKKVDIDIENPVKDRIKRENTNDELPAPPANPKGPKKIQRAEVGIRPIKVYGQNGYHQSRPSGDHESIPGPGGGGQVGGKIKGKITIIPGGGGGKGKGLGKGVGVGDDITGEKKRLIDWVLKHQGPLPPVVERAMVFDARKDVSALDNVLIKERGDTVFLYFVYRQESNLLRAMAIRGKDTFLFSLPGFELKARYIKVGSAELDRSGTENLPIVTDVQLGSTKTLPDEALSLFRTILDWLDIKEEADRS